MKQQSNPLEQLDAAFKAPKERSPSHADILIEIGGKADLFHTPGGEAFADVIIKEHRETWRVRNKDFRAWLLHQFYSKHKKGVGDGAMQSAIETLVARAQFEGGEREVHHRVAGHAGNIYIDIGDAEWRAIEVTRKGWKIIDRDIPVRFRRTPSMRALPIPITGGSINDLHDFVNVDETDFKMAVAFMLAALRPDAEYPVLGVFGVQGACKTTLAEMLRQLIDPREPKTRKAPKDEDDLLVAANGCHLLSIDNLSHMPEWMSDAICRICTGAGAGKRKLHTDDDEHLFSGKRPSIINGIEDIITRPDLIGRAFLMGLKQPKEWRLEEELWAKFNEAAPGIFGALLDGLVSGLKLAGKIKIKNLPRMADIATWAEACCRAYWKANAFMKAYHIKLDATTELILDANLVAVKLREFMVKRHKFENTPTELHRELEYLIETSSERKYWPHLPQLMTGRLRRVIPTLVKVGIIVDEQHGDERKITITNTNVPAKEPPSSRPVRGARV